MNSTLARKRCRAEMQGFTGLDDETLLAIEPWLRLSPTICTIWAAAGTALGSALVIWALVPFAALGALLPGHPFDAIYNHGIRRWTGGPRIPVYGTPRRFACGVASVWLTGVALAFQLGAPTAGYLLGTLFVMIAVVPVLTGFCIPSFLWGLTFGRLVARSPTPSAR